jgi:hypothetical protein
MLFAIKHLLLVMGLLTVSVILLASDAPAAREFGIPFPFEMVGAAVIVLAPTLLVSWPLYKLLHLRPLILPICPHCKKRHGNYHIPAEAWPDAVLLCLHCGHPLRLLLTWRTPPSPPTDIPTVNLRRPQFIGLWRRLE